ncbi:hypothetical protein [Salinilacihabitans rarus]|uniref:hypothetical protein n=1 Tax=Salinilacihabitans rarus TaxID=2961596 RepID=UPI0020C8519C|nr:hypothetical protein [Salinilacihabitans rarus]
MVDESNSNLNRRTILQLSGAGLTTFAGLSAVDTTAATGFENRAGSYRVDEQQQNIPNVVPDSKVGFAKGGLNKPVTQNTIDALYTKIIATNTDTNNLALPRPATYEGGPQEQENKVLGVVVSMEQGEPYISAEKIPGDLTPANDQIKKGIEADIHKIVDKKAAAAAQNDTDSGNGGD